MQQRLAIRLNWFIAVLSAMLMMNVAARANDLAVYDLPAIYEASSVFSLTVNGRNVPVVRYVGDYDYAHFSMGDGPVMVEITALDHPRINNVDISPWKLGIRSQTLGNRVRFTLQRDEYLIIRIDNLRRLVLLADPPETDKPASSGPGIFNVRDEPFAADPTGEHYATEAIQRAIDAASAYGREHGQGIVYIPRGVYRVGNLALKSHSAVYLEGAAVLRCTTDRDKLIPHWFKNSMRSDITWWLYTPDGATHVKLFGRGTLDGNGQALWNTNRQGQRMANNILVPMHVSGFTFDGLIVRDSSAWSVKPVRSDNLSFTNMKLLNRLNMSENDGIDVVESQNVVVRHAIGIALDDPFSFKTWAETTDIALNWTGDPEPNENILVERALSWTHCYGYKLGQGVHQPQRNITVRDSVVYDAAVGLGVHHRYGDATASNIRFKNIEIERQHGTNDGKGNWLSILVDHRNPLGGGLITNVHLKDIKVHDAGRTPALLRGVSASARIVGVTFDNIMMPGRSQPARNLHQMNVVNRDFYEDVTILPVQIDEPPVRSNIALGRNASASSVERSEPSRAFDGNLNTRWGSERSDPQWLAVDLGEPQLINGVKLVWEVAYARSYRIEVSPDGQRWQTVHQTNAGRGQVEEINFAPVRARHVRMFGTRRATQYGYSIWEFEVYAARSADHAADKPHHAEAPPSDDAPAAETEPASRAATVQVHRQDDIEVHLDNRDPDLSPELQRKVVQTFLTVYPELRRIYHPDATTSVTILIDPTYTGVANASGGRIRINPAWIKRHPNDMDLVTHEAMHVVQAYPRGAAPSWLVEGIADFARYKHGLFHDVGDWSLPDPQPHHKVTDSYRVTARFLVWVDVRVKPDFVRTLNQTIREQQYTERTWLDLTGQSLTELWAAYLVDPALEAAPVPARSTPASSSTPANP